MKLTLKPLCRPPTSSSRHSGDCQLHRRNNLEASDRFIDEVYGAFALLARMPHMGSTRRFRRESLKGLRLWRVPRFPNHFDCLSAATGRCQHSPSPSRRSSRRKAPRKLTHWQSFLASSIKGPMLTLAPGLFGSDFQIAQSAAASALLFEQFC